MSASTVRTRYAPSPTGEPHVGNIRTALFAWLTARANNGSFVLRIEDTDQRRKVEGAVEMQMEALRWLGVDWDEGPDIGGAYGPYTQSQRLEHYRQAADQLVESGRAYNCYCSPERLSKMRESQRQRERTGYDRRCRNRAPSPDGSVTPVVRFKMPVDGETVVQDIVRGRVTFRNDLLDDYVVLKSDGFPTYHLAHLVDDHLMEMSHVIRAEEWLPSLPLHIRIYEAFGWEPPQFAHVPNILAPDKSKLSKRHGATSTLSYREQGYVPDAILNFLALLGWSLDDRTDLIPREDLKRQFSLDRVSRSPAVFQTDKLDWMNGQYIKTMEHSKLVRALLEFWRLHPPSEIEGLPEVGLLTQIAPLISERLKSLRDAAPLTAFFFSDQAVYEASELVQKGMDTESTKTALNASLRALDSLQSFDSPSIEHTLRALADELGLKVRQLLGVLRVAVTGQRVAPPLFETIEILGRHRTLSAIRAAAGSL